MKTLKNSKKQTKSELLSMFIDKNKNLGTQELNSKMLEFQKQLHKLGKTK